MLQKLCDAHKTVLRIADATEEFGARIPIIEGELSEVEKVSPNGYRYRQGFWDKVLAEDYVISMIEDRTCLGTIEHPESDDAYMKTPYEEASHVVLSVVVRNHNPYGKFGILNNNKGNAIKALVEVGVPVGVSTRGLGEQLTDSVSPYIDENNYGLITWDIVKNPNFPKQMQQVSDSLRSNENFRQLIEMNKLRDSLRPDATVSAAEMRKMIREIRSNLVILENNIR